MDNNIVTQINASMTALTQQIKQKTQANVIFKEQVKDKIGSITEIINQIRTNFDAMKNKKQQIESLTTQMRNLEEKNANLEQEIARLQELAKQHGVNKEQLKQALDQKNALESQVEENTSTLKTKETQKKNLEGILVNINNELQKKIKALEDLTPGNDDILQSLEQIKTDLNDLTNSLPRDPRTPPPTNDIPPSTPPSNPSTPPATGDDPVLNEHKNRALGLISTKKSIFTDAQKADVRAAQDNIDKAKTHQEILYATSRLGATTDFSKLRRQYPQKGGKTRRHRKRRVSKRKTLKRKKLKGGYTADFEKKNKELRDKMRKRSKRHHSLRRPSSSTRKLSTSSKSSRRYKRSH